MESTTTATATVATTTIKDINWIKNALQSAIELEYSTLPLYLSSMFSLEVQNYTAYNTIRSVAMEEMVHMAIACNSLSALGGSPKLRSMQIAFPTQGLPGGAEPDLHVGLASFSKNQLKNFLRIEMPDFLLKHENRDEAYPTISAFYSQIKEAIIANRDEVNQLAKETSIRLKNGLPPNQVGDNIGFSTFNFQEGDDPVALLCAGIDEILEQGEGASCKDLITSSEFESEESHYAKFASLYYGAGYQKPAGDIELTPETEHLFFKGLAISWPEVINTLAVPSDGYDKLLALDPNGKTVETNLVAFDNGFSQMLDALETAWNGPSATSWKTLGAAVHGMVDLRVLSCFNIMRSEIPQELIKQLPDLYPSEYEFMAKYTDFSKPVFYGPRFLNTNS
jgi:hypothetical protein